MQQPGKPQPTTNYYGAQPPRLRRKNLRKRTRFQMTVVQPPPAVLHLPTYQILPDVRRRDSDPSLRSGFKRSYMSEYFFNLACCGCCGCLGAVLKCRTTTSSAISS